MFRSTNRLWCSSQCWNFVMSLSFAIVEIFSFLSTKFEFIIMHKFVFPWLFFFIELLLLFESSFILHFRNEELRNGVWIFWLFSLTGYLYVFKAYYLSLDYYRTLSGSITYFKNKDPQWFVLNIYITLFKVLSEYVSEGKN